MCHGENVAGVKSTNISRFELFQVFATQKSKIHSPHPDVDDEN